jgi:hypothetical protein
MIGTVPTGRLALRRVPRAGLAARGQPRWLSKCEHGGFGTGLVKRDVKPALPNGALLANEMKGLSSVRSPFPSSWTWAWFGQHGARQLRRGNRRVTVEMLRLGIARTPLGGPRAGWRRDCRVTLMDAAPDVVVASCLI